jgi:cysteine desulfurase/selenocysteine lyase
MSQQNITYLNTASAGLLSPQSIERAHAFNEALQTIASKRSEQWRFQEWQPIRETLAEFMDAPVQNVVFIPNFSFGLAGILHSLNGNERVLLYKNDFPSVLEPFRVKDRSLCYQPCTVCFGV